MKKIFIFPIISLVLIILVIFINIPYLNIYNTDFFHPLFGSLLPLIFLLFLASFLKNVQPKLVFTVLLVFVILDFILLSQIEPLCSQIICYDRTQSALVFSSLFSIVFFIVLLFKNKKR